MKRLIALLLPWQYLWSAYWQAAAAAPNAGGAGVVKVIDIPLTEEGMHSAWTRASRSYWKK